MASPRLGNGPWRPKKPIKLGEPWETVQNDVVLQTLEVVRDVAAPAPGTRRLLVSVDARLWTGHWGSLVNLLEFGGERISRDLLRKTEPSTERYSDRVLRQTASRNLASSGKRARSPGSADNRSSTSPASPTRRTSSSCGTSVAPAAPSTRTSRSRRSKAPEPNSDLTGAVCAETSSSSVPSGG